MESPPPEPPRQPAGPGPAPPPPADSTAMPPEHAAGGRDEGNAVAIVGLVLGILAVIFAIVFFPLGLMLGIAALVLGIVGRGRVRRGVTREHDGKALAALILGIVSVVLSLVILALGVAILSDEDTQREIERQERLEER